MPILDALEGLDELKEILSDALEQEDFSDFGGAEIVIAEEELQPEGLPRISLSVEDDTEAPAWGHTVRRATITALVEVSDESGAMYGTTNPIPANDMLSQFLMATIRERAAFDAVGLMGIEATGPREGRTTGDAAPGVVNAHRVVFYYDPED